MKTTNIWNKRNKHSNKHSNHIQPKEDIIKHTEPIYIEFSLTTFQSLAQFLLLISIITWALETASKLGGHHLHDQADPQAQHVSEQIRLWAYIHG